MNTKPDQEAKTDISEAKVKALAQEYIASEKGQADFGAGAEAGAVYAVYREAGKLHTWVVEVKQGDSFVGAAELRPTAKSFESAVFPKKQPHFWSPDQLHAEKQFREQYPKATETQSELMLRQTGYAWRVMGRVDGREMAILVHTSYCN